jgi:hypothetical protein
MTTYRVANLSTYNKRLILGSRSEMVKAKEYIDLELTPQELSLAKRSPEIIVSEIDVSLQHVRAVGSRSNKDEFYQGTKSTIAPEGERKQRPLYEHMMVEIFGLKSRIVQLETKNAELEAMVKACSYDEIFHNMWSRMDSLEKKLENKPVEHVERVYGAFAPSKLLNVDANPQESNRAIFEKIVDNNKELRKA